VRGIILTATTAAAVVCTLQPPTADARLFGRRQAVRPATACPGGTCRAPRPGLQVNTKGGFTGQLSDEYYAAHAGGQPVAQIATADRPAIAGPAAGSNGAAAAKTPAAKLSTIEAAIELVETRRRQEATAGRALALAVQSELGQAAVESARLQSAIDLTTLKADQIRARHAALHANDKQD
jgi:hypothetical protein